MSVDGKKIAIKYFEAVEAKSIEQLEKLFEEEFEAFFANAGVIRSWEEFEQVAKTLFEYFKELRYKKEVFIFTEQQDRIVVEGVEYGELVDGRKVKGNRFCSVFTVDKDSGLIKRMYVYTDPNFGLEG